GSTAHHVITYAHCNVLIVQVAHLKELIEKTILHPKAHPWQTPKTWENLRFSSGFGEEVKRGPRLSPRPPGSPYRGGTRKSEDDLESDEKSDTE
ncbi:MAG TPA: hypothetical protein PLD88_04890, partial [Candidatus Berkiella sp.]|nr:hypothetical protein [Candidatus Berkiella sp.]